VFVFVVLVVAVCSVDVFVFSAIIVNACAPS
jgi:hypothetical protein